MESANEQSPRRFGLSLGTGLAILFVILFLLVGGWAIHSWLFPSQFRPVVLSTEEQSRLDAKMRILDETSPPLPEKDGVLHPEPYLERPEDRVIFFTQRELNALIARNPELAHRVALHLSEGMLSATVLITMPQDMPLVSGRTVRVSTGLRLRHEHGRPVVVVEGLSIMGVPLPSAWLGGVKGKDLIALYGDQGGFWQAFREGVRDLRIEQGQLRVELAE